MKKKINILILLIIMLFGFVLNTNAENINDLKNGEFVVGSTKFSSNTWISASRAAKAGALYTNITGSLDIKTYYYVTPELIYELTEEGEYKKLLSEELDILSVEMNIYYENNEALKYTYTRYESVEEDLHFNWFFSNYELMTIRDTNVKVDVENETVTCNFGQNFEIEVNHCYDEECLSGDTETFIGKCGFDYKFTTEYIKQTVPIDLKEIRETEFNGYLNQDKVEIIDSEIANLNAWELNITGKLEYFSINNNSYEEDTYYAIDLVFDEKNNAYLYDVFSDYYFERDRNVAPNIIRLLIPLNMYTTYDHFEFAILDNEHNSFKKFDLMIKGLEKIKDNFEISDVKASDENINSNTLNIRELIYNKNDVDVYVKNNLNKIIHNDVEARWVTFDLEIDEKFKLEHLDVYTYYDENMYSEVFDTEIIENTLRLWINVDSFYENHVEIQFNYNLTTGRPFKTISFEFINESEELSYEWGIDRDSVGHRYLYVVDALGNRYKGKVNITYNNSNVNKDIDVYSDGYLLIPELVTINSVTEIEKGEY